MKFSIITVSYNSAATIAETIESVLAQNYPDIEYIIIDGGSQDGTLEVIDAYRNRIDRLVSEPDQGIYDAMNKGIGLASGDVIGFLNSDDFYLDDDVISSVARGFQESGADIVCGDLVYVDKHDAGKVLRYYSSRGFRPWKLRIGWMPPHPATFIRAPVYEQAGPYALDYKIAADYELFVRLLLVHACTLCKVPQVLVKMRMGGVSTRGIRSSMLLNREIVRACRTNNVSTSIFLVLSKFPFKLLELLRKPKLKAAWIL